MPMLVSSCNRRSGEVPPHEHRYVTVYFHARELRECEHAFLATVAEQSEDAIGALEFELAGKGTLPSVSVEGVSHEETGECVPFGRLQVGRTRHRTITVRNDGVLDATALINFSEEDKHFVCKHAGTSVSLKPGASRSTYTLQSLTAEGWRRHGSGRLRETGHQGHRQSVRGFQY